MDGMRIGSRYAQMGREEHNSILITPGIELGIHTVLYIYSVSTFFGTDIWKRALERMLIPAHAYFVAFHSDDIQPSVQAYSSKPSFYRCGGKEVCFMRWDRIVLEIFPVQHLQGAEYLWQREPSLFHVSCFNEDRPLVRGKLIRKNQWGYYSLDVRIRPWDFNLCLIWNSSGTWWNFVSFSFLTCTGM